MEMPELIRVKRGALLILEGEELRRVARIQRQKQKASQDAKSDEPKPEPRSTTSEPSATRAGRLRP